MADVWGNIDASSVGDVTPTYSLSTWPLIPDRRLVVLSLGHFETTKRRTDE